MNHSLCARVWVGLGAGGLLLVLPLFWAWGAAKYRSRSARKKVADWQVGSGGDAYGLALASYG